MKVNLAQYIICTLVMLNLPGQFLEGLRCKVEPWNAQEKTNNVPREGDNTKGDRDKC